MSSQELHGPLIGDLDCYQPLSHTDNQVNTYILGNAKNKTTFSCLVSKANSSLEEFCIVARVTNNIQLILDNCLCMIKERIFESIENARKVYESENYTAARAVRELAADTDLIWVEGL